MICFLLFSLWITSNWFFKQKLCKLKNSTHLCPYLFGARYWNCCLFNFGSPRSEIRSYGIPLNLLSNVTSQTKNGLLKVRFFPISHDDLIMDWFNRVHLYKVPHVTIMIFDPENDTWKTKVRAISVTFYKIQIWCSKRKWWWFFLGHLFEIEF